MYGITATVVCLMILLLVSRTSSRPHLKIYSSGPWPGLEEFPFSSPWRLETVSFFVQSWSSFFLFERQVSVDVFRGVTAPSHL